MPIKLRGSCRSFIEDDGSILCILCVMLSLRKRKAGKDGKKQDGKGLREEDIQSEEYLTIDPVKEAEMLLLQR